MGLRPNQVLNGAKGCYRLTRLLKGGHGSTVFKAEILPEHGHSDPAKSIVIKTTSPERKQWLKREYDAYNIPGVSSSPFCRKMCDIIGNLEDFDNTGESTPCLVFEWLDCTLKEIPSEQHRQNHGLLAALAEAILSSLVPLGKEHKVHTGRAPAHSSILSLLSCSDIQWNNILVSDLNDAHPTVKIGDLGLGYKEQRTQPFAMRATENWEGHGCFHRSDVWSGAVTLLDWIKPGIFGIRDIMDGIWPEPWCIAKLMRLFPDWHGSPVDHEVYRDDFLLDRLLTKEVDPDAPETMLIKTRTLDEELQTMNISKELVDWFRSVLVVDPNKRPSAAEALRSPEYKALPEKAGFASVEKVGADLESLTVR
ncbi:kinase-like domain-containing protein [Lineolata rhizophorae]|uniref:Kinase-like domain-containing protein n=1 Tax=Lineolata rhizophorae TaxID=578093 RepID=A0A6A6P329_9PEZI|nr:kinase-like domain-containing protein [Lineolata rhizophorae]